jgi:hypothetical protein
MGLGFTLLVVAAVVAWWWKRRVPSSSPDPASPAFRITFRAGRVARVQGHVSRTTLSAFEDVAALSDLDGTVRLVGPAELEFSDSVPPGVRQQLRNAYLTSVNVH